MLTDALPLHRRLRRLLRSILRRWPVPERLWRGVGRELHDMSHGHLQRLGRHGKAYVIAVDWPLTMRCHCIHTLKWLRSKTCLITVALLVSSLSI